MKIENRDWMWAVFFAAALLMFAIWVAGIFAAEMPSVNIPPPLRQENWPGQEGMGSCVHAAMISLFRWQGRDRMAEYWAQTYDSGEHPGGLYEKFDKENVRYAATESGDVAFLEWACQTRRGCGITVMGGAHMVTLVHLDSKWAAVLDNNDVSKFLWIPRERLIEEWKNSRGWAVAIIYTPPAPMPFQEKRMSIASSYHNRNRTKNFYCRTVKVS